MPSRKPRRYSLSAGINWRCWQHEMVLFNPFDNGVHIVSSQWQGYLEQLAAKPAFSSDEFFELFCQESLADSLWQQWLQVNIIRPLAEPTPSSS